MNETYRKALTEKLTELACTLVEVAGLLNSTAAAEITDGTATEAAAESQTAQSAAETEPKAARKPKAKAAEPKASEEQAEAGAAAERTYTYEEVRAALAEKARTGYRAEVKAILTRHGVNQLSEVKDQETFAAIMAEAEEIKVD